MGRGRTQAFAFEHFACQVMAAARWLPRAESKGALPSPPLSATSG